MKKIILTFFILGMSSLLCAQKFTHADSLKGGSRPERTAFDVYYYDINLEIDINRRYIVGWVDLYFEVVTEGVNKIQIDLYQNFQVLGILDSKGKLMEYKRDGNAIFVDRKIGSVKGEKLRIRVLYEGSPEVAINSPWEPGFVFKKDEKGRDWVAVACQATGSSIWWPSKDTQADEADSVRISIATQKDLTVVSNGNLRSIDAPVGNNRITEWFVNYPINNYDVSINIGYYVNFNEKYKGVEATYDLDYWVLDYNLEKAKKHFVQVKGMLDAFEKKLGPYPFPKDGFALVETPYLGMEHQSGIAYGNKYLAGYLGVERSGLPLGFDFIIIHEAGHEYWGNSLTTADVADMWVHEGFCTYSEALYVEELYGPDTALMYCNAWKFLVSNDEPIIGPYGVHKEGSGDMYNKGALMLHTLRWLVNDDKKWFDCIIGLQKDFRFQIVTGDQVIQYMNNKLGKDYTWLFDQYLKYADPPILKYELTEVGNDLEINIYWTNVSAKFALPLNFNLGGGKTKSYVITSTPQKITIKNLRKSDFWVDDQHAYYLVK